MLAIIYNHVKGSIIFQWTNVRQGKFMLIIEVYKLEWLSIFINNNNFFDMWI